jgi:hypothetical protein
MQISQAIRAAALRRGGKPATRKAPAASASATPRVAAAAAAASTASDVGLATASLVTSEPPKPLKKVAMVSLGCPKNTVDGESTEKRPELSR